MQNRRRPCSKWMVWTHTTYWQILCSDNSRLFAFFPSCKLPSIFLFSTAFHPPLYFLLPHLLFFALLICCSCFIPPWSSSGAHSPPASPFSSPLLFSSFPLYFCHLSSFLFILSPPSLHSHPLSSICLILFIFPPPLQFIFLLSLFLCRTLLFSHLHFLPHPAPLLCTVPPFSVLFLSSRSWAFPPWHQFVGCHDNLLSQVIYSSRSAWLPHNTGCVWMCFLFLGGGCCFYFCQETTVWTFLFMKKFLLLIQSQWSNMRIVMN